MARLRTPLRTAAALLAATAIWLGAEPSSAF